MGASKGKKLVLKKGKKKLPDSNLVVSVLLDTSGSMMACKDATISGFNEFLESQAKERGKMAVGQFNTRFWTRDALKETNKVKPLTAANYTPDGCTALYDAIGRMINQLSRDKKKSDRILCCIITDGMENSSKEYDWKMVRALIKQKEKTGQWTFTYIGANQDSWDVGIQLGLQAGNIANYAQTNTGTQTAFARMKQGTQSWRGGHGQSVSGFYDQTKDDSDPDQANS